VKEEYRKRTGRGTGGIQETRKRGTRIRGNTEQEEVDE